MFLDRKDAGQKLAKKLKGFNLKNPYVFGMARGGMPVAFEVAQKLNSPLDIVIVRKIGHPLNPEFGIGAIAQGNVLVYNQETIDNYHIDYSEIKENVKKETKELNRRSALYRGSKSLPNLKNKTAILVDDGLATGISAKAAINFLKTLNPKSIVLAVPVGASDSIRELEKEANKVICLLTPDQFLSVGQWYRFFDQTTDQEVVDILAQ